MVASLIDNRGMFWRIIRRLLFAHRGRLFVILLALVAGAAITAALLNLQVDAKRRLNSEFRAFGANVVILPKSDSGTDSKTLPESVVRAIPLDSPGGPIAVSSTLFFVAQVFTPRSSKSVSVVVAGLHPFAYFKASPTSPSGLRYAERPPTAPATCVLGERVVGQLGVQQGANLVLTSARRSENCQFRSSRSTGGPEDNHIEIALRDAQLLAEQPGRVSAIELAVPGKPLQVEGYVSALQKQFPDLDVHPIRQFTAAQAKIYSRISGLLNFTVALVLILTSLCVMAAMANVAMERRNDVGLMKAIGGARRRVLRLFLTEATLLGLIGGLIGAAAGIALSMYLGKAVFGLAARPRLIVYPVSVVLTMIVAILSAYPLRHLANVRPTSVFRGEA
jgi:putative ABC transport system permease protein